MRIEKEILREVGKEGHRLHVIYKHKGNSWDKEGNWSQSGTVGEEGEGRRGMNVIKV